MQVDAGASNVVVRNNGYYPGPALLFGATDAEAVGGVVHFANAAGFDFRLLRPSRAIDAARGALTVARDFAGLSRPRGTAADLGAHEFVHVALQPAR